MIRKIFLFWLLVLGVLPLSVAAQEEVDTVYIPIGGSYTDTFEGFLEPIIAYAGTLETDRVYILVLPMTFTYDPFVLTTTDLIDNTQASERRRRQLEDQCSEMTDLYCEVVVPPIYTREAAEDELTLDYFAEDLAGVYFLGGDQVFAMQITANTPLEEALADAFARGVPMGGNSAGLAIGSRIMIAGYDGDEYGPENGFNEGAVLIWNDNVERGLSFGATQVVLEQHFWERARFARFLNALARVDLPPVGIGVDTYTGGYLVNGTEFGGVFGLYGAVVLDVESLAARESVKPMPVGDDNNVLSIRNVLMHTLAPGDFAYDVTTRTPSWAPVLTSADRETGTLALPEGAGTLSLIGGNSYVTLLMPSDAPNTIFLAGYADAAAAAEATGYIDGEGAIFLDADTEYPDLTDANTIALVVGDLSLVDVAQFAPIVEAWEAGANLVLGGEAAALAGTTYTPMPPTPYDSEDDLAIEMATQGTLLQGGTPFADGLGLLPVSIEVSLMADNRYGRWVSLAYNTPDELALGMSNESMIVINEEGARVIGGNVVLVLDLSAATLDVGDNDSLVIANGIVDVVAPSEFID